MEWQAALEWALKAVMVAASVFVFLLGRDQKRHEELIRLKADAVKEKLESALALRDRRLDDMQRRLDTGGEELSELASFAQGFGEREERLRREIGSEARQAKHDAVNAIAPLIADLNLRKMDERLHSEQIDDLRRRLRILEERS